MTGPWQGAEQARASRSLGPTLPTQGGHSGRSNHGAALLLWNNGNLSTASSWDHHCGAGAGTRTGIATQNFTAGLLTLHGVMTPTNICGDLLCTRHCSANTVLPSHLNPTESRGSGMETPPFTQPVSRELRWDPIWGPAAREQKRRP